ncbi:MAG: o-succinylbenzoate--CoA ligase [Halobacteriales archaeon]
MEGPVGWPAPDLLTRRARTTPDRTALVDDATGRTWSYRQLDRAVGETATALLEAGVDSGVRIGTLLDTRVAFVRVVHAAMRVGAELVPLNVRLTPAELEPLVERAGVKLLIAGAETEPSASEAFDGRVLTVDPTDDDDVEDLPEYGDGPDGDPQPTLRSRDDTAVIMFTSGTTGRPKAVRLTVGNLVASATASAFRLGVDPDDRWLVTIPMYHMGGLAPVIRSTLYGTTVVLRESFDPDGTIRTISDRRVTGVSLVPTMLRRLLDAGWSPPDRLRFVLLGGAPAPAGLIDRCEDRGVPVHPTYGMTETASQIATARPEEAFAHEGTVGQPLFGTSVAVVNDDGEPLRPGEPGELVVDGPIVTPGYLDEATTAAFSDRGLHTGDVGYRDEEGHLWVLNRLDDRILTGGELVDPGEVVDALRGHAAVVDAAVVGLDDPEWGERVAALVATDDGVSANELASFCEGRLAGFKRPRTWGFCEELPRTASGTVDREAVRTRLREDV